MPFRTEIFTFTRSRRDCDFPDVRRKSGAKYSTWQKVHLKESCYLKHNKPLCEYWEICGMFSLQNDYWRLLPNLCEGNDASQYINLNKKILKTGTYIFWSYFFCSFFFWKRCIFYSTRHRNIDIQIWNQKIWWWWVLEATEGNDTLVCNKTSKKARSLQKTHRQILLLRTQRHNLGIPSGQWVVVRELTREGETRVFGASKLKLIG